VRILRTILYTLVVAAGMVLASVNMTPVRFTYLPDLTFLPLPPEASIEAPLALLLLAAVVLGTLIVGTGTFVEHLRLRLAVRRQAKVAKGLRADLERVRQELQAGAAALEARAAEVAAAEDRARKAEEALARREASPPPATPPVTGGPDA